jgi:hypothetical protein
VSNTEAEATSPVAPNTIEARVDLSAALPDLVHQLAAFDAGETNELVLAVELDLTEFRDRIAEMLHSRVGP